jgi:hypothetical protein
MLTTLGSDKLVRGLGGVVEVGTEEAFGGGTTDGGVVGVTGTLCMLELCSISSIVTSGAKSVGMVAISGALSGVCKSRGLW